MSRPWYDYYHGPTVALLLAAHGAVLCASIVFNAISWDEGWNFCVAKNWVLHNHYGCSFNGEFTTPRLSQGPITVAPIALGFKLFGVGFVQGRIFQGLITLAALVALYLLTRTLAGKAAGLLALSYLLGVSGDQRIHPGTLGGQGWGETSVILFVALALLGMTSLAELKPKCSAGSSSCWREIGKMLLIGALLGVAAGAKHQAAPFIFCALAGCAAIALTKRDFFVPLQFSFLFLVAYLLREQILKLPLPLHESMSTEGSGADEITRVIALVFDPALRWLSLEHLFTEGFILLVTLGVLLTRYFKKGLSQQQTNYALIFLTLLCSGWILWYGFSARPFKRYLAPPLILGAPLVAILLASAARMKWRRPELRRPMFILLALFIPLNLTLLIKFLIEISPQNGATLKLVSILNTDLAANAIIETYDAQLFFLLERPYRYPPDKAHLAAMKDISDIEAGYEPLKSPASAFVLGPWSSVVFAPLFEPVLESKDFSCWEAVPASRICERVSSRPGLSALGGSTLEGRLSSPE